VTERADWPALLGTPLPAFRRHFEINVFAAYELIQLAVPVPIDLTFASWEATRMLNCCVGRRLGAHRAEAAGPTDRMRDGDHRCHERR
jgi:hypothetical protein